jgi:hypothetical protein
VDIYHKNTEPETLNTARSINQKAGCRREIKLHRFNKS